jgi:prevent-host-death family protein
VAYTVHQAKTHFSRLLKEVESAKEVIVMRGKKPVAKIVSIEEPKQDEVPFRLLGAYRGKISWTDDAFDPLSDEELVEMGLGYMTEAPLVKPRPARPRDDARK